MTELSADTAGPHTGDPAVSAFRAHRGGCRAGGAGPTAAAADRARSGAEIVSTSSPRLPCRRRRPAQRRQTGREAAPRSFRLHRRGCRAGGGARRSGDRPGAKRRRHRSLIATVAVPRGGGGPAAATAAPGREAAPQQAIQIVSGLSPRLPSRRSRPPRQGRQTGRHAVPRSFRGHRRGCRAGGGGRPGREAAPEQAIEIVSGSSPRLPAGGGASWQRRQAGREAAPRSFGLQRRGCRAGGAGPRGSGGRPGRKRSWRRRSRPLRSSRARPSTPMSSR
jgi:hypothetical protein